MEKFAPTDYDVINPIKKRWSPRAFADKDVPEEELAKLFAAAQWAASSYNEQPWRYMVASKHRDEDAYKKIYNCFNDFNQQWASNAPVAGLSFAKTYFADDLDNKNDVALHDVGAASAQLSLQAAALDLYVHQMAGIEKDVIQDTFEVPDGFVSVAGFVIGYGGDPEQLDEDLREQENAERERQEMEDFVWNAWGKPASFLDASNE